ncbi:uncharacterized protein LOC112560755 [Pomacea canaliculata]|uniref:uncharacterized protein LOC112560755 n=1 Tax=Pomacea canaliculata TaxID=400727 RepID=UPI000D7279BC|nr:uncharacterized protein LOC112560755 [Pomacea canaliculata]
MTASRKPINFEKLHKQRESVLAKQLSSFLQKDALVSLHISLRLSRNPHLNLDATKMKCVVIAVLFAVLLHYSITVPLNNRKLTRKLRIEISSIRNTLIDQGLISPDRQSGFVLLGDADTKYFQRPHVNTNLVISRKIYRRIYDMRNQYDNFLAALPLNPQTHSEDILLDEFAPRLYNAYRDRHGHAPQFILLYSYYVPCTRCTERILNIKQSSPYRNMRWFVAYTNDNYGYPGQAQQSVNRMEQSSIHIIRV